MEELSDKEFWRLTIDMSNKHKEDMIYSKEASTTTTTTTTTQQQRQMK